MCGLADLVADGLPEVHHGEANQGRSDDDDESGQARPLEARVHHQVEITLAGTPQDMEQRVDQDAVGDVHAAVGV